MLAFSRMRPSKWNKKASSSVHKHTRKMDKRHYPKLNNYASSGFGFLKKLAMDGWFAGAAGPFFATSLGL